MAMWTSQERCTWIILFFLGTLGLYASRAVMPITSVSIAGELGWKRNEIGFVMSIFFWGYAVTQYLGGCLSDKYGGELVIALSSLGWAFLTLSFIWLPQLNLNPDGVYDIFLLARFLLGLFQGFFYPSLASLMSNRVRVVERNFTYAILNAGAHLGTLLCGSVGSYLVTNNGWRAPFFLIGVSYILWSITVYRRAANSLNHVQIKPVFRVTDDKTAFRYDHASLLKSDELESVEKSIKTSEMQVGITINCTKPNGLVHQAIDWPTLLKYKPFWVMLLANFAHNNTFYIILNWCPSYFHDNYPDARSWVFNMVPWLIIFPTVLIGGALADHWIKYGVAVTIVRKVITSIVLVGSSLFLLILSTLDNYYGSLVCMACALACLGFHSSGVLLNPQDMAPSHGGRVYGIMATVGTIPGFTGVYMAGYLLETTNQWSVIFILTSLFNLFGWIAYVLYGSSKPLL